MKRLFVKSLLCLALAVPVNAGAQNHENYIEVHGSAENKVTPDRITFSITINENDYRKLSLQALEKDMKQALTGIGIDIKKYLKVRDISSSFTKIKQRNPDAVLSKSFQLELTDAATAYKAVLALDNAGISNVRIVKTEYSAMDSLKIQTKADAMKNAKKIAEAMTGAIGQPLGPAIYIYEQESHTDSRNRTMVMMAKAGSDAVAEAEPEEQLDFKDITVTSKVTVRFKLND